MKNLGTMLPSVDSNLDFALESSAGGVRRLASLRGRVVVLFWEDRDQHRANPELKQALSGMSSDPRLAVLAVGDVSAYDFAPARGIVRGAITAIARTIGVEILFDWSGALAAAPFSLVPGRPNVLVLDRAGRPILRAHGTLGAEQQRSLLDTVRAELAAGDRAAA